MQFSYKAIRADGGAYESTVEAADRFAVYKDLHAKGEAVVWVHEKSAKGSLKKALDLSWGGIKAADRVLFAKNLSAMLRAGLPLARALGVLEKQVKGKEWMKIFAAIQEDLAKGTPFSASLAAFPKAFGSLFVSMVAAGEESGNLSGALQIVGEELEKAYELKKKVRGAMLYPIIILSIMLAIAVLMFVYVLPKLTATFRDFGADLPMTTRAIIAASDFVQANWPFIVVAVLAAAIGAFFGLRSKPGKRLFDRAVIKLPFVGTIAKEVNSARMARTLSSLLSSGVEVVASIRIASGVVQNVHYREMLEKAAEDVQKGSTLQSFFVARPDLYPPFVGEMIGVGEETGTLSKALLEVAVFYEAEVSDKTKNMSTVIEPLLMVVIGLGVGFFALAMIAPIYSLSNKI